MNTVYEYNLYNTCMKGENKKTISEIVGYYGNFTELVVDSDKLNINMPEFNYDNSNRHPYSLSLILNGNTHIIQSVFSYNSHLVLDIGGLLVSFTTPGDITIISNDNHVYPGRNIINITSPKSHVSILCNLPLDVYLHLAHI